LSLNTVWSITYGDYEFAVDRTARTIRLAETRTGTVWADDLPVGEITLQERATGALSRHPFGTATLFSLSEKAGPQGKEILFGLDVLGVPVDLYFTCGEREIRLTVEANRDTKTYRVHEMRLLPGLCRVPDDGASYLVLPHREGVLVRASDVPRSERTATAHLGRGGRSDHAVLGCGAENGTARTADLRACAHHGFGLRNAVAGARE
jgi:hypothetical protein